MTIRIMDFPAERIAKGVHSFTPEMGQRKANCQLEARLGFGGRYRVVTPIEIELKGRGVTHLKTEGQRHIYYLTDLAFDKLKTQYSISMESNLD